MYICTLISCFKLPYEIPTKSEPMKTFYRAHGTILCIRGIPLPSAILLLLFTLLSAGTYAQVNSYASVTSITTASGRSKLNITKL